MSRALFRSSFCIRGLTGRRRAEVGEEEGVVVVEVRGRKPRGVRRGEGAGW